MKPKNLLLLICFAVSMSQVSGQYYYRKVQKTLYKDNKLGGGGSIEVRLPQPFSLAIYSGFIYSYISTDYGGTAAMWGYVELQPRYYYNIERRRWRGYNTIGFSADFVAVSVYAGAAYVEYEGKQGFQPYGAVVPMWGLQRRLKNPKSMYYSFFAGAGAALSPILKNGFTPAYGYGTEFGWYL